jgi:hypothetical protein
MKLTLSFAILFFFTSPIIAQWNTSSAVNTPVSLSVLDQQEVRLVSDSFGGAILVWEDFRANASFADIYLQGVNANGYPKWSPNGIGICTNIFDQRNASICAAPAGSAIIAWQDFRNGNWDIYTQKVDSIGYTQWASNGVPVCNKPLHQTDVKSVPDLNGGAFFVWVDSVIGSYDIYAQHIDANGNMLWSSSGLPVCTAFDKQNNPRIELDGSGGCIITWMDKRFGDYDIYAQRIDANGNIKWQANGTLVVAYPLNQSNPKIDPDGMGGAIISWQDFRNNLDYDVYAQRIDSVGVAKWATPGVAICSIVGSSQSAVEICSKGGINGAIIAWKDGRAGIGVSQVYIQRIDLNGQVKWQNNGLLVGNGINPNLCEDGDGGVIVTWQDSTLGDWNVLSQRIDSSGNFIWSAGGVAVGNAIASQSSPKNVPDGKGGSIYAFQDKRNLIDFDIYAHHIYFYGSAVGINENSWLQTTGSFYPNPVKKGQPVNFLKSYDLNSMELKDLQGKTIHVFSVQDENAFSIPTEISAGVYILSVIENSGRISTSRLVIE